MALDVERRDELIAQVADRINYWGLSVPGIVFLEANKPFSFLASQFLLFLQPLCRSFVASEVTDEYIRLLEDRGNVERLIQKLELNRGLIKAGEDR